MTKHHKNRNIITRKLKGGKVIGSGGFGCIFNPAIKCKKTASTSGKITKLMKKKYANAEYKEVSTFYQLLKNIPHFSDYFLLDGFSVCKPEKLSKEDLVDFDEKCNALQKIKINSDNINNKSKLNKLLALNMPYGGVDVNKYIDDQWDNPKKMLELNHSLVKLLEFGIIPMNDSHVFHCDLKASNILAREEEGTLRTRIIDWGLSTNYNSGNTLPRVLTDRPFQFNVPFSNVLFTSFFNKMYTSFLVKHPEPDNYKLRTFVINFVLAWVERRGPGHLKTINNIFKNFFENELKTVEPSFREELIEYEYTFYFIFQYITNILKKFTKNGKFDQMAYLNNVYLKNIDLWGFVVSYIPIVEDILNSHKKISQTQFDILEKIKNLYLILINSDDCPINTKELVANLNSLNSLFKHLKPAKIGENTTPSSSSTSSDTFSKREMINELETTERKDLASGPLTPGTRKMIKKRRLHKTVMKTLKNIKSMHSKKAWI